MHPEVIKFAEAFAEKMKRAGRDVRLNENELRYLDRIHGPEFNFNFQGLTPQMPFIDYRGNNRYIDFYYESGIIRILIEIDSLKYHVEDVTHQQYDGHLERQNDMILSGGCILLRFSANMIRRNPMLCRRQLVQAVGKCLIAAQQYHVVRDEEQIWTLRKWEILQLAKETQAVKPVDLVRRFGIHRTTAANWLQRMVKDGELQPIRSNKLITGYRSIAPSAKNTAVNETAV